MANESADNRSPNQKEIKNKPWPERTSPDASFKDYEEWKDTDSFDPETIIEDILLNKACTKATV